MSYEQLFKEIENQNNKVLKTVIAMKGDIENVKYSLRSDKGKTIFYVLGSTFGTFAPAWVVKAVFVNGDKQSFSMEQCADIFTAIHTRHCEEEKQRAMIAKQIQRAM